MEKDIINDYINGLGLNGICAKYKIGKLKVKTILNGANVPIRKRGGQQTINPIIKTEKYKDGKQYEAIAKDGSYTTSDFLNLGGKLTTYIKKIYNVDIPSLYDRKKYYATTGNYWWEQWFEIKEKELKEVKKCPYCEWTTIDTKNTSGAFAVHLLKAHNLTVEDYLIQHAEDKDYFHTFVEKLERKENFSDSYYYTVCPICKNKYNKITQWHTKTKHGLSLKEFKQLYPDTPILSLDALRQVKSEQPNSNLHISKTRFVSKQENLIRDFLDKYNIQYECNRKLLIGKEIDILIPSLKIGIEVNGLFWHSEWNGKKDKNYHLNKTVECNKQGYDLIHIFEDELHYHADIVLAKLAHILHLNEHLPKIKARQCEIIEISSQIAQTFLGRFHIQGFAKSTIHLGCVYQNQLIGVMSFKRTNHFWELTRFATDYNYIYQGVGSKLFKYFVRKYNPQKVVSFADRRWTMNKNRNLYTILGFKLKTITQPDYRYYNCKIDKYKRFHKMNFRKQKLNKKYGLPLSLTESEMVKKLGYDRIWDCGLFKYVWEKEER